MNNFKAIINTVNLVKSQKSSSHYSGLDPESRTNRNHWIPSQVWNDMLKIFQITINNEGGFILVASMITMVALTVIGLSGSQNSTIEIQVAGNERHYNQAFYASEAGWQHGVQAIEEMNSVPSFINPFDQDDPDNTVDEITDQILVAGQTNYNYSTEMIILTGSARRAAGFSGTRGYRTFKFMPKGQGTGPRNSTHESWAVVDKVFDTE